ncbi:hypothetical protein E3N88_17997 [Mikania micrantha]|uniref:Uncharacterized protein n=1 Tax=Mikania micrantha TaxID=192012 RepID=A0A5N6NTJ8_9ASTR|nr:hypothetical protein E3N88_17997 [Mikania micrantha]
MDSTLDLSTFDFLIASYNEESFVTSKIEVHPINDDPILCVDEDDGYVPNLSLIHEECYEIPTNGDVDDHLVFPPAKKVSTSKDVQQSKKANGEDFEGCYTFLTPNGTKVWCPNQGCDIKPTLGATYGSWSDVLRMYKNYAECSNFSVHVGQTKKNKSDQVTHKYLRCNKAGRPQSMRKFDTLDGSFMSVRNRSFQVTDSHRLQVPMKGGHHNVKGTPTDFKNFSQAIRLFIGNRDSQLLLDLLRDRVSSGLLNNTDFWACMHRLVWYLFMSPTTFETRWVDLITRFQLEGHNWLSDMYAIRDQSVPPYFREIPMCCLMKTTSRVNRIVRIPDEYVFKRWMKDVLPKRIFEIQYRYGVDNSPESLLRNEILGLISNCADSLRNDYDGLAVFANKVRELSRSLSSDPVDSISKISNVEDIQNVVGGSFDVDMQ